MRLTFTRRPSGPRTAYSLTRRYREPSKNIDEITYVAKIHRTERDPPSMRIEVRRVEPFQDLELDRHVRPLRIQIGEKFLLGDLGARDDDRHYPLAAPDEQHDRNRLRLCGPELVAAAEQVPDRQVQKLIGLRIVHQLEHGELRTDAELTRQAVAVVQVVSGVEVQRQADRLGAHIDLRKARALLRFRAIPASVRTAGARSGVGRGAPAAERFRVELKREQQRRQAEAVFDKRSTEQAGPNGKLRHVLLPVLAALRPVRAKRV